jgi:hypothetical protein
MRAPLTVAAALLVIGLSACSGATSSMTPGLGGAGTVTQPQHRMKNDAASITAAIKNTYASSISLQSTSGQCLSASPPGSVGGGMTSPSFTITDQPLCVGAPALNMTYGPALGTPGNNCTFSVTYSGTWSYSVANQANTSCYYTVTGVTPLDVLFVYQHN